MPIPRKFSHSEPRSAEITPRAAYEGRREWLRWMAGGAAGAALASWAGREALAQAVSANLKYLLAVLAAGGRWDSAIAHVRREAGLASNNAEQVLQRLRIERRQVAGLSKRSRPAMRP